MNDATTPATSLPLPLDPTMLSASDQVISRLLMKESILAREHLSWRTKLKTSEEYQRVFWERFQSVLIDSVVFDRSTELSEKLVGLTHRVKRFKEDMQEALGKKKQ